MNVGKDVSSKNSITVITGLAGSGKSTLLKTKIIPGLLQKKKKVLVVDVNKEYKPAKNLFVFRITDYANAEKEIEQLISKLIGSHEINALVVDESNVVFNKYQLQPYAKRLVNTLRHERIDLVCVARRPVDINVTISELAQKRYIFYSSGYNDIQRLNNMIAGLGDKVLELGEHDYLIVDNDRKITRVNAKKV